jgi:uncharacterized membrane protein YphA (DoxX/SURF4 family)
MKKIMLVSRLFVGLVFVFSGFTKAVDPMGSAIKFEEYFLAFHFDFLAFAALPLAIALSAAELLIGLNLLVRLRMKFTAWLLLIFMSFFTLLTFVLALTNPVSDCGCFGDAVKLTNWQTFWKNIILFVPVVVVFHNRRKFNPFASPALEWIMSGMNFLIAVVVSGYCIFHQPILDFRPYAIGTSIPEKMSAPPGAPGDKFKSILVYEKNGVRQEFTESNFPWQDTTWKWVQTKQTLISKGYEPPIHDFSITDGNGFDITEQVLQDTGYTMLIIAPNLSKASLKGMRQMNDLNLRAVELGMHVYCLTSSTNSEITEFKMTFQPAFDFCTADETTLKTIIRANPGVLLLLHGTIVGKWNYRDAPRPDMIRSNMLPVVLNAMRNTTEAIAVILLALVTALFYAVVYGYKQPRYKPGN